MANPVSIRMDESLKARLENAARAEDRSLSWLAQKAITKFLDERDFKHAEILRAYAEAEKGVFISDGAMMAWVDSWDMPHELPMPQPDIFAKR